MRISPRVFALAALGTAALVGLGLAAGCSSEDPPAEAAGDAAPFERDGGGTSTPVADGGTASADACATTALPGSCTKDEECPCGTVCAGLRCVPRAKCDEALLSWDGPTANADGTCVADVTGYLLNYGRTSGGPYEVVDAGNPCAPGPAVACGDAGATVPQPKCAFRVGPLDGGTWYFAVAAFTANQQSAPSGEVSKTITCP